MEFVDAYRDAALADGLSARIAQQAMPGRRYRLMEFCGGHTHAIARHGLADRLPGTIELIHGPGCPVCVLPVGRIDQAIRMAIEHRVVLCSYGDAIRVPGSARMSLQRARSEGADVRIVYSPLDALAIAEAHPEREVVMFAIGFETTTAPAAASVVQAQARGLRNYSLLANPMLTPAAMGAIVAGPSGSRIDGFIGPAHVSTVIGSRPYERFAREHRKPVVIAGFEPLDLLLAIERLIVQLNEGRAEVDNAFPRAVLADGNRRAIELIDRVFELRESYEWRGLGTLPASALQIRPAFASFDAERRHPVPYRAIADHKACECAAVLRGEIHPEQCRIFGTGCTPSHPIGACMVSAEGACAAHFRYGRFRRSADGVTASTPSELAQ